jgi:hypothetical protein
VLEFKITYLKVKLETTQLQTLKLLSRYLEIWELSTKTLWMLVLLEVPKKLQEWSKDVLYTAPLLLMLFLRVLKDPGVTFILVNF